MSECSFLHSLTLAATPGTEPLVVVPQELHCFLRLRSDALSFAGMTAPLPELSPAELARYSRHILLEEIGVTGQRKLTASRVLIVGAGGLGSPAALYLAAAGVGTIGIADFDRVEEHNLATLALPRQAACPLCGTRPTLHALLPEYYAAASCVPEPATHSVMPQNEFPLEISVTEAKQLRDAAPDRTAIIDVREPFELDICKIAGAEHIPMRQIPERLDALPKDKHLLIMCHAGGRSRRVTEFLRGRGFDGVSNIAGGIDAWAEEIEPGMRRY